MNVVLNLLLFAILFGHVHAATPFVPQSADPVIEPWRWTDYPFLKDKRTRCVVEDPLGSLWFGTDDGVWQYDGMVWAHYGHIGEVRDLCIGSDQNLYAGSDTGLWVMKGTSWVLALKNSQGFPWEVSDLCRSDNGILWAATTWGSLHILKDGGQLFTTQDIKTVLEPQVNHIAFEVMPNTVAFKETVPEYGVLKTDTDWVYWATPEVLNAGLGLHERVIDHIPVGDDRFDLQVKNIRETRTISVKKSNSLGSIFTLPIFNVLETKDQKIWMTMIDGEPICYDLTKQTVVSVSNGYQQGNMTRLFETDDASVWALSEDESVGIQKFDGQIWEGVPLDFLGGGNLHTHLFQTRDGVIWVGGHQGAVGIIDGGHTRAYGPPTIPLPRVRVANMIQTLDGALWFVSLKQGAVRFGYQTEQWVSYEGINFQCESVDGDKWFLSQDRKVVRQSGEEWVSWSGQEGLMSQPSRVITTRDGGVWAVGSHEGFAATAKLVSDGAHQHWQRFVHADLSWAIEPKAIFEDANGSLWFGGAVGHLPEEGHLGGLLTYDPQTHTWQRFYPPDVPAFIYGIGESKEGTIWVGSTSGLHHFNGIRWSKIDQPSLLRDKVDVIHTGKSGRLWVGLRGGDVFVFDGQTWQHFTVADGLPPGRIRTIFEENDKRVWVGSSQSYSLFDGHTWEQNVLHANIPAPPREGLLGGANTVWINRHIGWNVRVPSNGQAQPALYTLSHQPNQEAPDTWFLNTFDNVPQPGHAIFEWAGIDVWQITPDKALHYSWRIDQGPWSPFTLETHHTLWELPDGPHTFEVVARDQDLNVDASPAILHFEVTPPVWRQAWFMILMTLAGILVIWAIIGGVSRHRFLKTFSQEQRALQVVSDAVQNMFTSTALHEVIGVAYEQLKGRGLDFHTLTIHEVLDVETGQCLAHEMGTDRQVVERSFTSLRVVSMSRANEVIYRPNMQIDAGGLVPEQLKNIEDRMGLPVLAILDVPHGRGLISIHSATPQSFSGNDITFAKHVAEYIALGISRADDISRLNESLEGARRLAHVVEHSPTSVVITNVQGNIEYVNPQFEQVTGYSMDEVVGKNPRILKSGESPREVYQHMWQTIKAGGVWRGEFHNKKKNGELYWEAASISGVKNDEGKITHYIAVKEDVTQKKEMEKALLKTERDQVLVATAGAAAHEINQPLTVILGLTQLLMNTVQGEQLQEDLGYMEEAGQTIKQIVSRMAQTEHYETQAYVGETKIVNFSAAKRSE